MLFILNPDLAFELAGIADAASTDNMRPALARVKLELLRNDEAMTLRAVATDSYLLGKREITFLPGTYDAAKDDKWAEGEPILVEARQWKKALIAAAQLATKQIGKPEVLIDVELDGVTIVATHKDGVETTLPNSDVGQFPAWEQLMGSSFDTAEADAILPSFDADKLNRIWKIVSAKVSNRGTFPLQMNRTAPSSATLKPWLFVQHHTGEYTSDLAVLLMPMRVK